jgi:predicted unusual protein kinase regulating ubiquinone biosynthesis (AarF/ABC1/UbiB family)
MPLIKSETKRLIQVIWKLFPIGIRYRSDRKKSRKARGKITNPESFANHAKKAVKSFIQLGPAYIKLGQLLSVRPDLLPQPYIEEFSKLQDEVPPAPFDQVEQILVKDLGKLNEVFESFDPNAVTGASLGQVYRARYKGKEVVIKVNRPGIRDSVAIDTKVLRRLVPLVGRFIDPSLRFTAESVVDQFAETVQEEVDYKVEASNLLRIKRNLRQEQGVVIPDIFPEISTDRILVLEYFPGVKISDTESLDRAGIDRSKLARRVAKLFFKMLLSQDMFHADPHPGNISITNDGRIVLYDFGMTGTLDDQTRTLLIRFYTAIVDYDSSRLVDIMLEMGVLQPTANRYVIRSGVELAFADMQGRDVKETEVKALMEIANRTIYQFPFKLPKNLVLYMRMLSILEGVCLKLDPNFRFVRILGGLLEDEGLLREAYKEDLKDAIKKLAVAVDASIEVAPLIKTLLENDKGSSIFLRNETGKMRLFGSGVFAGLGASGVAISLFFLNNALGKLGLAGSLLLLVLSIIASRS